MNTEIQQQNNDGGWSKAEPIRYKPSLLEQLKHLLGFHVWTYTKPERCVICHEQKNDNE